MGNAKLYYNAILSNPDANSKTRGRNQQRPVPQTRCCNRFFRISGGGDILGYGAGIEIYEWPALAAFNVKLVAKACQVASSLATETADQLDKAIKLALYGLHWRDHKDLAAKYLQRIGNPLVREVLVMIDPQPDCLADHIKKSGATYAIFDTPGGKNEKRYIHKVSK